MIATPENPITTPNYGIIREQTNESPRDASTSEGMAREESAPMQNHDTPNDNSSLRLQALRDIYEDLGRAPQDSLTDFGLRRFTSFQSDVDSYEDMIVGDLSEMICDLEDENPAGVTMLPMAWLVTVSPVISKSMVIDAFERAGFNVTPDGERMDIADAFDAGMRVLRSVINEGHVYRLKTMPYKEYLQSTHWQDVRRAALETAGHRCRLCNSESKLHVHHRTYERRGEELPEDVIALCENCHQKFHDKLAEHPS